MAKNNLPAASYAKPHTMSGGDIVISSGTSATADKVNMSVGNITREAQPGTKTSGLKMRGAGAATKGTMCRGPMG
tara:strand:- start:2003 stop:2227 length:225 start_codon:yes stop_codon:yes gene_type:complete